MPKQADELGKLRRRRARQRWVAGWSISLRISYPPGRVWRAVASIALAGIVCAPALAALFATQVFKPPLWMNIAALLLVPAMPFMWRVVWRDDVGVHESDDGTDDAA